MQTTKLLWLVHRRCLGIRHRLWNPGHHSGGAGLLVAPLHADFGWSSRQIFLAALVNRGAVIVAPSSAESSIGSGARVICLSFSPRR